MTALDDLRRRRQCSDAVAEPEATADLRSVNQLLKDGADEVAVLEEENDRLRQRLVDLELSVTEYRSLLSQVLTSASWKMISPIRATASRYRSAKVKSKKAAKSFKHGKNNVGHQKVLTAGLFMPDLNELPETRPLRQVIDINTLHHSSEANGRVHSYEAAVRHMVERTNAYVPCYKAVFQGWDNTARRGALSHQFFGANLPVFRGWVQLATDPPFGPADLTFVNAPNVWAEGASIEHSMRFRQGFTAALSDGTASPMTRLLYQGMSH